MEKEFETYKDSIFQGKLLNIILPILFVIISIVLFVLSPSFKSTEQVQNYMYINNQILEYQMIIIYLGLLFLLCAILYIALLYFKSSKRKFLLFENRIQTTYKNKKETEILFTEMSSIYKFRTFTRKQHAQYGILDCMAYRKDDGEFLVIKPDLKHHKNKSNTLIEKITERFIKENLDKALKNIHNRKVVRFDYLNSKLNQKVDNLDKTLYTLCYKPLNKKALDLYKKTAKHFLIVERDGIIFGDEKIEFCVEDYYDVTIHNIDDQDKTNVAGKIFFIKDKDNNTKFELDLIGLVNSDFFIELVSKIYDIKKGNADISTEDIQEQTEIIAPDTEQESEQDLEKDPEQDLEQKILEDETPVTDTSAEVIDEENNN